MLCMLWCRCLTTRELLEHHQKCTASDCPVCTPVKQYVQKQRMAMQKGSPQLLKKAQEDAFPSIEGISLAHTEAVSPAHDC